MKIRDRAFDFTSDRGSDRSPKPLSPFVINQVSSAIAPVNSKACMVLRRMDSVQILTGVSDRRWSTEEWRAIASYFTVNLSLVDQSMGDKLCCPNGSHTKSYTFSSSVFLELF